jgi:hypothetical protein
MDPQETVALTGFKEMEHTRLELFRPSAMNKSQVICDMVYNWGWNHYPPADLDCEISVFSLSKATGEWTIDALPCSWAISFAPVFPRGSTLLWPSSSVP